MRPARATLSRPRRLAALALGLWLSGAGCLVCCERAEVAAAHDDSARADTATHDLLAAIREAERAAHTSAAIRADHSCCKARAGSRARKEVKDEAARAARDEISDAAAQGRREARRETVPGRACCRRALQSAEQARKPRVEPAAAHAPATGVLPVHAAPARARTAVVAQARAPDGAGTYLRCRVLLI